MNVTAAFSLGKKLMKEHGLNDWTFKMDKSKRRFGLCSSKKFISLSAPLTEINDEDVVTDTILHEIAHALVGCSNQHNNLWQKKAVEIGASPVACYKTTDVNVPIGNWHGTCPGCKRVRYQYSQPRVIRSCGMCSPTFDPKFIFQWEKVNG